MFINFNTLYESRLNGEDLLNLIAIKQLHTERVEELTLAEYNRLQELSLVKHIKAKNKKEHPYASLRLSDKGKKFLEELSFEGAVDEESEKLKEWVIQVYKNKAGGIIKNKTELGRRIQWFKVKADIKGNFLALLIQCAMNDTYNPECGQSFYDYKKDNPRAMLSNMAENLFWSPDSIFDKHKNLDKSPLYTYYEDNKEYIQQVWEANLDEEGNRK